MKTLKSIILGLALIAVCGVATAKNTTDNNLTPNHAINTYVDAMTRGKLQGLGDVLDKSASFSLVRGKAVFSCGKKEMIDYFQSLKNVEQICTTSTSVIESGEDLAIVKVDMKYDTFVRSNYVTVAKTPEGWKITNVYSTFK